MTACEYLVDGTICRKERGGILQIGKFIPSNKDLHPYGSVDHDLECIICIVSRNIKGVDVSNMATALKGLVASRRGDE